MTFLQTSLDDRDVTWQKMNRNTMTHRNEERVRLRKQQQRDVVAAMLQEARARTVEGVDVAVVQQCVRQVRGDMKNAIQQGVTVRITMAHQEE